MSLTSEPIFRSPTAADAQSVLDMMIRCDIAEYGEEDSDLEDLTYDWGEIELEKDAWPAFDSEGDLVGYAAVLPWGEDLRFDFYSDPEWPEPELGRELLDRCLARGRAIAAARDGQVNARTFVAHSNQNDLALVRQAGFEPGRYIFQMWIEFDGQPSAAVSPPGISVRCAIPGQDDRQLHALIQEAFHQPGRTPQPFEDWRDFMMRADVFDPEL